MRLRRAIDAIVHELRYGPPELWDRWKRSRDLRARREILLAWFGELSANPPDVLVGANIAVNNGIRFHIEGIRRYSSLRVELAPSDEVMRHLSYHDLRVRFREEVMGFDPTGIHVVHSHVYPYFVQWCRRHNRSDRLWVHTYHAPYFAADGPLEPWQHEINETLENDARHADVRISVSLWQQRYLSESLGIETVHIPNGVDAALCDRADGERFRSQFGREPFALFVGRNESVKNPADFVAAARILRDVSFIAIGAGMTAASLRMAGIAIPPNLRALGPLSRQQVHDAIAASAAVVVTSRREGLPTVVLETHLSRKPVVVPNDPGSMEAIADGRFGHIYEQGDIDALASATLAAIGSSDDVRDDARNWVLATYDWKVVASQIDAVYRGEQPIV
jgi:glycosyltransferase involved in cell wall biosynthesis